MPCATKHGGRSGQAGVAVSGFGQTRRGRVEVPDGWSRMCREVGCMEFHTPIPHNAREQRGNRGPPIALRVREGRFRADRGNPSNPGSIGLGTRADRSPEIHGGFHGWLGWNSQAGPRLRRQRSRVSIRRWLLGSAPFGRFVPFHPSDSPHYHIHVETCRPASRTAAPHETIWGVQS